MVGFRQLACSLLGYLFFRLSPPGCYHDFKRDVSKSAGRDSRGVGYSSIRATQGRRGNMVRSVSLLVMTTTPNSIHWMLDGRLPDPFPPSPPKLPETPLYPLLHADTPVPIMTYPHLPFPPSTSLFPSHEYIERYHQDYVTHYDLWPYIKFNHSVLSSSWVGAPHAGHGEIVIEDHNG
ncbi:hypothetical protein M404DRAFT_1007489, partial [Pisolithus tinctorius Marx 270]